MVRRKILLMIANGTVWLALVPAIFGEFTAYNDTVAGPLTHSNTTLYTANGTASGFLKDTTNGSPTPVVLSTAQSGVTFASSGVEPWPGTDAANMFSGKVDFSSGAGRNIEVDGSDTYTYSFSGLDAGATYSFAGTAIRGEITYSNRWTLVTLNGADSFSIQHSNGDGIVTNGLAANEVALWSGDNGKAGQGFVVQWTGIRPGIDGVVEVVSRKYSGSVPTNIYANGIADGAKGYAITGIRLTENPILPGMPSIVNTPASNITISSAQIGGVVTDPGSNTPYVIIYYGDEDAASIQTNWAFYVEMGPQSDVFSTVITNLDSGATYYFRTFASNSVGERWASPSLSFDVLIEPPIITNLLATNITGTAAELAGTVIYTGGDIPDVTVYYGRTNSGATFGWETSVVVGAQSGLFSVHVTGLVPDTNYYFCSYATNAGGASWASNVESFLTLPVTVATVTNTTATDHTGTSAILHGIVTDSANDVPVITVYYGKTDGGTVKTNWEQNTEIGLRDGVFTFFAGALDSEATYYFTALAKNAAGESWAEPSLSFETLTNPVLSVVINEIHYDPLDKTSPSEFIEIYNTGDELLDLSGWRLSGIDYTFPMGATIGSNQYVVVAQDSNEFFNVFAFYPLGQWGSTLRLNNDGEQIILRNALGVKVDEVNYGMGFPWPTASRGMGSSIELIYPDIDNDLGGAWRSSAGEPTPGAQNSVYSSSIPPRMRQVNHGPDQKATNEQVVVTVKVTDPDGIQSVNLKYQVVEPGDYISFTDSRFVTNWIQVAMYDDGLNGDSEAGDTTYSVILDGSLQQHRRLIRYKITAQDMLVNSVTVPYADDPQTNFAYFVYGNLPDWTGSARPGVEPDVVYSNSLLASLPICHLITRRQDHLDAQHVPYRWGEADQEVPLVGSYGGEDYPWEGALVYNGMVYDHVHYRARGGVWRYAMGKNMWKFDFNLGHRCRVLDNYGNEYDTECDKLNMGSVIQQGDFLHRGEQGLFESVGFKLLNLTGVEAPNTSFLHFRIIEDGDEGGPDQFSSDFQGLYLTIEQMDGRLLDEHGLPDGNIYKMESWTGTLNNQGPTQPSDTSDLNTFMTNYNGSTPSEQWWRDNLDLQRYYSYRSIVECMHHYDIGNGKNYFYYHNPDNNKWQVHPWDLDLTWADNMYGNGNEPFKSKVAQRAEFSPEYRNRLREVKDLLYNTEQTGMLIGEVARFIYTPGEQSFVDADRARWDYNPLMMSSYVNTNKAGFGRFYKKAATTNFPGMMQIMKNYIVSRGAWVDANILTDESQIPGTPTITYTGDTNYPINALAFECSSFFSPTNLFAAMKWRIAEVTDTNSPGFDPSSKRKYEITANWESAEITVFTNSVAIPGGNLKVGRNYRVRVRMKGDGGRWSHWSAPHEFVTGDADNAVALADQLKISELMFDPVPNVDMEYVEICNTGTNISLDLEGCKFTAGIDFTVSNSIILAPGEYLLVVRTDPTNDFESFRSAYGLGAEVKIVGPYSGKLANEGEVLTFKTASAGTDLFSFEYSNGRGWPLAAQGIGHSMVPLESAAVGQAGGSLSYCGNWRASTYMGGSPGSCDPEPPATVVINEMVAHTDISDTNYPAYDSNDKIELFNRSAFSVNLTNWYLSDNATNLTKWAFPDIVLPSSGFLLLDEINYFHSPITNGFGLDKAGEELLLSYLPGTAEDRVVDAFAFMGQENSISLGRVPSGSNFWCHQLMSYSNANYPPLADLVISEIMYHHPVTGDLEYVEIFNPTHQLISLFNTTGVWRLNGGVDFDFPAATALDSEEFLLVVPFDPMDGSARTNFLTYYSLGEGSVDMYGPYEGSLSDKSERIALERPQEPDVPETNISWVIVDELIYADQAPFPPEPDGTGPSLHRITGVLSGNDPSNWRSGSPSPGSGVLDIYPDQDGDSMADIWEFGNFGNLSRDGMSDWDKDNSIDLYEFLAGTIPTNSESVFKIDYINSISATEIVFTWPSSTGRVYSIVATTNLFVAWTNLLENIAATPPDNTHTVIVDNIPRHFFEIQIKGAGE